MELTTITISSPLGRWTHTEWRPPTLASVVDHLWHFEGEMALPRERTFPGGYLELILHLGPRFRDVDANGRTLDTFPLACVGGVQTRALLIEAPPGPCCVLGIRLHPLGAYALLGCPLHETAGLTIDLADLAGPDVAQLTECCYTAPTVEARFRLVAVWITRRLATAPTAHAGVTWAAGELARTHGAGSIAALRDRAGLGRTRFSEAFRAQVGLTPKQYARVLRFRRALALLQRGQPLSTAALTAGYYDQPHMNADFREMAGLTPAAFVAASRYPNTPSLAEPA